MALKLKLNEREMADDFFEDTCLLGIASSLPPYRLCWVLNDHFDINLTCEPDMTLELAEKDKPYMNKGIQTENVAYFYTVYEYQLPNSCHRYLLYQLKNNNVSLLPDFKKIDYLWLIQTADSIEDTRDIADELRKIPDVLFTQVIEPSQIKNPQSLLV